MPRRGNSRVGTLCTLKLAVYERPSDRSLFFVDEGCRVDLHGNQKWEATDGRLMRGYRHADVSSRESHHEQARGSHDDMARAIAASLQSVQPSEEAQIAAAIQASLDATSARQTDSAPGEAPAAASPATASPAAVSSSTSCLICMEDIARGQAVRTLRCAHSFHQPCVDRWLRTSRTCPVCRERA